MAGLAILVLLASALLTVYWSPILERKVKSLVLESTDSLYHIDFESSNLNFLRGEVVVNNVTFKPDSLASQRKKMQNQAPGKLYTVKVQKLVVSHIHPFELLFNHKLNIGEIFLNAPDVTIAAYPIPEKDKKPESDHRTVYQRLSNSFKMVRVGRILFDSVRLTYINHAGAKPAISKLRQINLTATDLLIDSATQFDKSRFFYCRDMTVELHNYNGRSKNALYAYKAKLLKYSTLTRQLSAYNLTLSALKQPDDFFKSTYGDIFYVHVGDLQLNNFDVDLYETNETVRASSLTVTKGAINVYSNPRKNPKSLIKDKAASFPHHAIHKLPVKVIIDTVRVRNYEVRYKEFNKKTKRSGYVSFNHISGNFYHVTNDSAALQKNHWCSANIKARFMNRAALQLAFNFNLTDSLYSYNYKGSLAPLNMQAVNVATVPLASIEIKKGMAKGLNFSFEANRKTSRGKVTFLYTDLTVHLLKADTAELKMRHLALQSLLANTLILKSDNPAKGEAPRTASVVYTRPLNKPFFATLWSTLLAGIKDCAGLDARSQQEADAKAARKEKHEQKKTDSKDARKKKKEEERRLKKLKKEQEKARKKAEKERQKAQGKKAKE